MKINRLSLSANLAVLLSLSLLFAIQTDAASYPESAFYSLYQDPRVFTYTDTSGNQQTQTRYGFRYQNDLTDSIVVCGKENDVSCVTNIYNTTRYLNVNRPNQYISSTLFKIYIPPGSSAYTLLAYVTQSTTAGISNQAFAVARFGRPPDADSGYVPSDFSALPVGGGSLGRMINSDYICVNTQGYLEIVTDYSPNITTESQAGWLYVIMKAVSGSIISYYSNNEISVGTPNTPGTYLGWYTTYDWNSMGDPGSISNPPTTTPTPTPTPTNTPTTTPTPTPTTTPGTGCNPYACANMNGSCVNGTCVIATPTPTPTPSAGSCDPLTCFFSGGTCVGNSCVKPSATPTPTPGAGCNPYACANMNGSCVNNTCVVATPTPTPTSTPKPTPTPTPTPTPSSLSFTAKPLSQITIERKPCTNIDLNNFIPVLTGNSPLSGNVNYYSALFLVDANIMYFAQKDLLNKDVFLYYASGDPIKGLTGTYDSAWNNTAFKSLFGEIGSLNCASIADSGIGFLFGYAPQGDTTFSQFQGAAFTFVTTP